MGRQTTEDILVEYAIHLGFGEDRNKLARELEQAGLTGLDLKMVCDHVKDAGTEKTAGRRIASVLHDKNKWGPLLADLRRYHEYRHAKKAKAKKQEPGKGLREQDQAKRNEGMAAHYGMTHEELLEFRWRYMVAEWMRKGHPPENLEKYMDATRAEIAECVVQFPDDKPFEEALAEYCQGKTDASQSRSD